VSETVDELTAKLAQCEQTIAALKSALVAREKRINELELAIARLERGTRTSSEARSNAAKRAPSGGTKGPSHPLIVETVGVYPDLWTDVEAMVRFVDEVAGHKLRLSLFVPSVPGEETKDLLIAPNFAAPTPFVLSRGSASRVEFDVPSELALRPELRIQLHNAEPLAGNDRRRLGVKIGAISLGRTGDKPEAQ
jgi:hypothetical protein